MADEYKYRNWNNAAIKSSLEIGGDSVLIYGNTGIWLTTDNYLTFTDFNQGFDNGIDNRKIFSMIKTLTGDLYAGTLFGLFYRDQINKKWLKIDLPVDNEQVTALLEVDKQLMVMTRSLLLEAIEKPGISHAPLSFNSLTLLPPLRYDNKTGLFKTLWVIHSGEIYGVVGKLIIDLLGLLVVVLTITGTWHFLAPYLIRLRKRKKKEISKISTSKRIFVKWHKQVGVVIVVLIIINSPTWYSS